MIKIIFLRFMVSNPMFLIRLATCFFSFAFLVGCNSSGATNESNGRKSDVSDATTISNDKTPIVDQKQSNILFDGRNLTIFETDEMLLSSLSTDRSKKPCAKRIESRLNKEFFQLLGDSKDTESKSFEVGTTPNSALDNNKMEISLSSKLFSGLSSDNLLDLDESIGYLDFERIYLINRNDIEYLLLTGHPVGTSGVGHYLRVHTLYRLFSNEKATEFDSLLEDPSNIRIGKKGELIFSKVQPDYYGAIDDSRKSVQVNASILRIDSENREEILSVFSEDCKSFNDLVE